MTKTGLLAPILERTKKYNELKMAKFYGKNKTDHSNNGKNCFFLRCSIACISCVTVFE